MSEIPAFYTVSPQLLQRPQLREALRQRDFQTAFALMRQYDGASQERIASAVEGLTQGRVSRVMSGRDRLASLHLIERLADGLRIPGELLGLAARSWEHDQATGLIVEAEHAELHYDGRQYHVTIRRRLRNVGGEPVTRFLIRIAVDRYPDEPQKSNEFYRANPLTFSELQLSARCGSEPMTWKVDHDRDADKEVWLLFGNPSRKFPIYPGNTSDIAYSFTVSDSKWGNWFERAIRLPTQQLTVTLTLPRAEDPAVWGTETSLNSDAAPIRNDIEVTEGEQARVFRWFTERPRLHARYRFEWRMASTSRGGVTGSEHRAPTLPSASMAEIGIVQRGSESLRERARPCVLPDELEEVRHITARLLVKADQVRRLHDFAKGIGIAAPQIGVDRAIAVVLPSKGETITLINPQIVESSDELSTQYEGCLSFFDVRGEVPRPLRIAVEHCEPEGAKRITVFAHSVARLVAHEVDHLEGVLYTDRMLPGVEPISISKYRDTGKPWGY